MTVVRMVTVLGTLTYKVSDIQGMVTVREIGTILGMVTVPEIGTVVEMVTGDPPSDSC